MSEDWRESVSERAMEAVFPRRSSKGCRLVMTGMAGLDVDDVEDVVCWHGQGEVYVEMFGLGTFAKKKKKDTGIEPEKRGSTRGRRV